MLSVSDAIHHKWRRQALIDAIASTRRHRGVDQHTSQSAPAIAHRDQGAEMNRRSWRTLIERQPRPAPQLAQSTRSRTN